MLPTVAIARFSSASSAQLDAYASVVGEELMDEVHSLARDLRGLRVCHLNSTGTGGGVAELLARHVPFCRALGLAADWRLMAGGTPDFFASTKRLHNALQGGADGLDHHMRRLYREVNRESARLLGTDYDIFVVHDPQPAAFRSFAGRRGAAWIWRCHIDTSAPDPEAAAFLLPFLGEYDAAVFTLGEFVLPGLTGPRIALIAPAIDPFSTKNMEMPSDLSRAVVANAGIDLARPLILQVSRFDPWKDPLGVIAACRRARTEVPGLQLVLIGAMAGDDPEGWRLLSEVEEEVAEDPDIQVFTNLAGVGSLEVNAFQRTADIVIQKSLREGFGLVVSESFWKGRPMVCGNAGGIPMQYPGGYGRFLVDSTEDCAGRMIELLGDPGVRRAFGEAAREHVRRGFLLPRLVRDELRLFKEVLERGPAGIRTAETGTGSA